MCLKLIKPHFGLSKYHDTTYLLCTGSTVAMITSDENSELRRRSASRSRSPVRRRKDPTLMRLRHLQSKSRVHSKWVLAWEDASRCAVKWLGKDHVAEWSSIEKSVQALIPDVFPEEAELEKLETEVFDHKDHDVTLLLGPPNDYPDWTNVIKVPLEMDAMECQVGELSEGHLQSNPTGVSVVSVCTWNGVPLTAGSEERLAHELQVKRALMHSDLIDLLPTCTEEVIDCIAEISLIEKVELCAVMRKH